MTSFRVGDQLVFQHAPGGTEHPCTVTWLQHPPAPGCVKVRFASGTEQWVGRDQLRFPSRSVERRLARQRPEEP